MHLMYHIVWFEKNIFLTKAFFSGNCFEGKKTTKNELELNVKGSLVFANVEKVKLLPCAFLN